LERTADIINYGLIFVLFGWLAVGTRIPFIPKDAVFPIGMALLFGWIGVQEIYLRTVTAQYNYIRAVIRPSGKILRLFIKNITTEKISGTANRHETTLDLGFKVVHSPYGKVSSIKITHYKPLSERIDFDRGYANFMGLSVWHPNVAEIELYEYSSGGFHLDHEEPIPCFELHTGGKDYYSPNVVNPFPASANGNLYNKYTEFVHAYTTARRAALGWQQRAIKFEGIVESQKTELLGLVKQRTDFKGSVREEVLNVREAQTTIENALKNWGPPKYQFMFNKYVVMAVLGLAFMSVIVFKPDLFDRLASWLTIPYNAAIAIIALVVVAVVAIYIVRKK
jgi:hypothetical protein